MWRFSGKSMIVGMLALSLFLFAGCAGDREGLDTAKVSGKVTLGGQPVEGAQVVFAPTSGGGKAATGRTDASGNYALTTLDPEDGALPGSYRVMISKTEGGATTPAVDTSGMTQEQADAASAEAYYSSAAAKEAGSRKAAEEVKDLLPAKYKNPGTSGFTAEVKSGENNVFDFALTAE